MSIFQANGIYQLGCDARNLSVGFLTRYCSNQPAQLQRVVRTLMIYSFMFKINKIKGADQTAQAGRLLCYQHATKTDLCSHGSPVNTAFF